MSRRRRKIAALLGVALTVPVLLVALLIDSEFARYQPRVAALQGGLPNVERQLPLNVQRAFLKLTNQEVDRWVARNLLWSLTERTGNLRWHLRFAMWETLIPSWYNRSERLSLFAHFLTAKDATGLQQVSRVIFAKDPDELSVDEALGLLVVLRGPSRFSPSRAPAEYRRELEKLKTRLGAV